jgi:hypothetical protein
VRQHLQNLSDVLGRYGGPVRDAVERRQQPVRQLPRKMFEKVGRERRFLRRAGRSHRLGPAFVLQITSETTERSASKTNSNAPMDGVARRRAVSPMRIRSVRVAVHRCRRSAMEWAKMAHTSARTAWTSSSSSSGGGHQARCYRLQVALS